MSTVHHFKATIEIIGVNPYVLVPDKILSALSAEAGQHKGKIPVNMTIDGHAFTQTLVKYAGYWRLYLNMPMRKAAGKETGAAASFSIAYNAVKKTMPMHPALKKALQQNKEALAVFESLSPSMQLEIKRYIMSLKTQESIDKNTERAILFLLGKGKFVGRERPPVKQSAPAKKAASRTHKQ